MTSVTSASERAVKLGELWGARAADWSATEELNAPSYEAALRELPPLEGRRVLDLGCGAGVFLRMAADRGAAVSGLDASEGLLAEAARRVPEADLRLGELDRLPFADDAFDVVTAFSSIFFALDPVTALREAGRVARPGAVVVVQVWGREERCSLLTMKRAAARRDRPCGGLRRRASSRAASSAPRGPTPARGPPRPGGPRGRPRAAPSPGRARRRSS